ncbi:MAG TPA: pyridoxamine 5'-phosphate oxidase family protein [Dehalococcoidia bacterium]|nr:pyridoxamine 5'-phosphate oxidase family protein [Dehalococcoidia bacterium]
MALDRTVRQQIEDLCAGEKFGVLATVDDDQPYTASIRFATTPDLDLIVIARAATRKAQNAGHHPAVAFQVDNREITKSDQTQFTRVTFLGDLQQVTPESPEFEELKQQYLAKIPEAAGFFQAPDINLYRLKTRLIRFNSGFGKPTQELTP